MTSCDLQGAIKKSMFTKKCYLEFLAKAKDFLKILASYDFKSRQDQQKMFTRYHNNQFPYKK